MATEPSRKPNARGDTALPDRYSINFNQPLPGAGGGLPAYAARDEPGGGVPLVAIQVRPEYPPQAGPLQRLAPALGPVSIPALMTPLAHGTYIGGNGKANGKSNGNGHGNGNGNGHGNGNGNGNGNGHGNGNGKANGNGHGNGHAQEGYYIICEAPPGPPAGESGQPWTEADLIDGLLRPVATALERLQGLGLTHRAIRPTNVFRAGPGTAVLLGMAWGTPPGLLQPAIYEPPYSAMCAPGGRGVGHIGDDVYALAMTMITLARGRPPLAGLDDDEIMRRKLDVGCHAAVTAEGKLPPIIVELTRGMLAEDAEHRTTPAMLTDPLAARGRRPASRPMRRALRSLDIGGIEVWNNRSAAYAICRYPDAGAKALRTGEIDQWLRRNLGDVSLAGKLDDIVRQKPNKEEGRSEQASPGLMDPKSDPIITLRAVAAFDPLAPLSWRGTALWPDGLGPALAVAHATAQAGGELGDASAAAMRLNHIEEIIANELLVRWGESRPERSDVALLRMEARQHRNWQRQRGSGGGVLRLIYGLNQMLRCASPLLAGRFVMNANALLTTLEALSSRPELRRTPPMDRHIAAFIASRAELPVDIESAAQKDPVAASLLPLRMLSALQTRLRAPPLPGLAQWLVETTPEAVEAWQSRSRRAQITDKLAALARRGDLLEIVRLLEDERGRAADAAGLKQAMEELARLDKEIANMGASMEGRTEEAQRLGHEICVGIGLVSLVVAVGLVAL